MKLLELTDFYTKTDKEYVVVEKIARIQRHTEKFAHIKSDTVQRGIVPSILGRLFGEKSKVITETVELSREIVDRNGSEVVLSDGESTNVLESPEEVAKLLAAGNFIEVKGV